MSMDFFWLGCKCAEAALGLTTTSTPKAEEIRQHLGVSKDQLEKGEKTELEHTDNPGLARTIALDHLKEMPDYYTQLAKMERR